MKVNVTCVQMEPKRFDLQHNIKKMAAFVEGIMDREPSTQLIVFPELITSGYQCGARFQGLAERAADGESIRAMGELAKKRHVHIIYGFPERDPDMDDVLYNSVAFLDSCGSLLGTYRKVHLFASEREFFRAGCDYPLFDTEIGKIGIMVCWDTAFPEVARIYALKGAQLIALPTNWEKRYLKDVETRNEDDWDLVVRARAFDNCLYVAGANRIGFDETLGFFGRSKIVGPTGVPLAELNEEKEGTISAELDYSQIVVLRQAYYTLLKDRRPDTYDEIVRRY